MKKKNFALAAALGLTLAACTSSPLPGGSAHAARPQSYRAMSSSVYGEWFIEPATCTIRARAAEFTLVTDGRPSRGTLNLRALFTSPLVKPPVAEVSEILVPLPIEGSNRGYNIILAYDATNAAHMLKPDTYLMVRYQPMLSTIVLESSFSTRGLMQALADLAKHC